MGNLEQDLSSVLRVQPDPIPEALRAQPRWVGWRLEDRDGKPTKVPYSATDSTTRASTTDPAAWTDFPTALATYQEKKLNGIGFVLGDDFFGFDCDDCRNPMTGEVTAEARELIALIDTYTEVSPRARGVKAVGHGQKPGTRCRTRGFELYDHDRLFCITGHHLAGTPTTIENRAAEVAVLYRRLFPATLDSDGNGHRSVESPVEDPDDVALIEKAKAAKNGVTFTALWRGETSGYPSHSEADQALANLLAFWCASDAARMDRLFRQSNLMREKWDSRRGDRTYGAITIERAVTGCREAYHGPIRRRVAADRVGHDVKAECDVGVRRDDFHAYMPMHPYIFAPSRELWPASSVNARIPPIPLVDRDSTPVVDKKGNPKTLAATTWLDQYHPVEQMTWIPGLPMLIRDRLVSEGGWIDRAGCTTFNLYRKPRIELGDPQQAERWRCHVRRIYPDDVDHIEAWLAHRAQRPEEKINHGLVLGGPQGIGKDTLAPLKVSSFGVRPFVADSGG